MIKGIGLVCVVLGLATVVGLISAETLSLTELDETSYKLGEALSRYFPEINDILRAELPDSSDPEENMKVVRNLVRANDLNMESKRIALRLIAELDSTRDVCTHWSYKAFAKNYIANNMIESKTLGRTPDAKSRTRIMLDHYARIHAKSCGAFYRRDFKKKLPKVDKKSLQRIERAFKDVFRYNGPAVPALRFAERRQYLSMELENLSESPVPEATDKILANIMAMVKESDMWKSLKTRVDKSSGQTLIPKPTKYVFEEFLFKPCASYEKLLGETLSCARLDAFVEEEGKGYLADEQFYEALMHSRLCKKVLEEQSNLEEIFIEKWKDMMSDSI